MKHIVATSGGKDSSALALRLKELHPKRQYTFLCTPTGNELPDMLDHWKHLEELLGQPIEFVSDNRTLYGEILRQRCLPSWRMRWCTRILKIQPFHAYLAMNRPAITYVGLRADEIDKREGVDHAIIPSVINEYPMVEWGWTLKDVADYLACRGVTIPMRTDCAICPMQTLYEWWRLWDQFPDEYEKGVVVENLLGHTLRSDKRDTWPAALVDLRREFEGGRKPREASRDAKRMCSWCAR